MSTGACRYAAGVASTRVFLLDDHEIVRRGLRDLLEAEDDIEVVGEAGTAEEALRRVPATRPDVAVLDVRLPDGNGVEVCREIRSVAPRGACLMLTSFSDDEALFDAIMAGASGYLLKQIRGTDLVDSVRRVAAGQSLLDPAVTATGRSSGCASRPRRTSSWRALTEQERKILDLLAEGLTNRQIGERAVPGREDGQELRVQPAHEAGHAPPHRGRRLRRQAGGQARPSVLTDRPQARRHALGDRAGGVDDVGGGPRLLGGRHRHGDRRRGVRRPGDERPPGAASVRRPSRRRPCSAAR